MANYEAMFTKDSIEERFKVWREYQIEYYKKFGHLNPYFEKFIKLLMGGSGIKISICPNFCEAFRTEDLKDGTSFLPSNCTSCGCPSREIHVLPAIVEIKYEW